MASSSRTPDPSESTDAADPAASLEHGKGRPTPTRKEREAANKRPLVPTDRRQASRDARAKDREARERQRIGMANGEERFLPVRDRGPQKRYVRDYVDARLSLGEVVLPLLLVVLLTYFLPAILPPALASQVTAVALLVVWAYIGIVVIEGITVSWIIKRKLADKFGAGKVERGVRFYAFMRMVQFRLLRMPKPQVKRGQFPS
ncbi:MAG: DUF3043 domain-containing protein [Actinomycetales bacterium]|nr:DUF3043 domain-containing protein [Actinomycetales bacterium]